MIRAIFVLLTSVAFLFQTSRGFVQPVPRYHHVKPTTTTGLPRLYATVGRDSDIIATIEEIRSMRVKEIKAELTSLGASTADAFEKEELVQRLAAARRNASSGKASSQAAPPPSSAVQATAVLQVPLYLTSLVAGTRVAAADGKGGISIDEAADNPYPAIKLSVQEGGKEFTLTLLLDTACSGIVLRPSVVQRYNLPSLQTPVTMTGAGGTQQNTGLTQLNNFRLEDGSGSFGPLPAAVQDIGALPSDLDGIIGLSFLSLFAGAELDFRQGALTLYRKGQSIPPLPSELDLVADGPMSLVPGLSVYAIDVFLGGRGPVHMLVDTGASNTFLNWKGVSSLGLERDSKFLNRLPSSMGAMGSDAVAMQLTHRINISSNLNLGSATGGAQGMALNDERRLSVDIGDIAILQPFTSVGGILGIDTMMKCNVVRFSFGANPRMQMLL